MLKVLIVYYSRTGNTEAMARAVAEGVKSEEIGAEVKRVDYTTTYDLMSADAFVFGSPCYFGYMAGIMKDFFDRNLHSAILKNLAGKPAAAIVSDGETNGGEDALLSIEKIFAYFMLEKVAQGVVNQGKPGKTKIEECQKLGMAVAQATKKKRGSLQVEMEKEKYKSLQKWRCQVCDYVYDPELGDPTSGIMPGIAFEKLPENWVCPICRVPKTKFEKIL